MAEDKEYKVAHRLLVISIFFLIMKHFPKLVHAFLKGKSLSLKISCPIAP